MATNPVIARLLKLAAKAGLSGIEQSTSYGTPALKVAAKLLMRIKDDDTLMFRCALEDKELTASLVRAWRLAAPKRLTRPTR